MMFMIQPTNEISRNATANSEPISIAANTFIMLPQRVVLSRLLAFVMISHRLTNDIDAPVSINQQDRSLRCPVNTGCDFVSFSGDRRTHLGIGLNILEFVVIE